MLCIHLHVGEHVLTDKQISVEEKKLAKTLAALEPMMPVHWNTITRCLLLLQPGWVGKLGDFWATNMMAVERLHVLVKNLCRSRKNIMASFLNNYKLFSTNQLDWRFCTEYANDPRPSSLCWKDPVELKIPDVFIPGG